MNLEENPIENMPATPMMHHMFFKQLFGANIVYDKEKSLEDNLWDKIFELAHHDATIYSIITQYENGLYVPDTPVLIENRGQVAMILLLLFYQQKASMAEVKLDATNRELAEKLLAEMKISNGIIIDSDEEEVTFGPTPTMESFPVPDIDFGELEPLTPLEPIQPIQPIQPIRHKKGPDLSEPKGSKDSP